MVDSPKIVHPETPNVIFFGIRVFVNVIKISNQDHFG
jgi:hypothetical protein